MEDDWYDDDESDDGWSDDSEYGTDFDNNNPSKHDQEYKMDHPRRGKALIFNFFSFANKLYRTRIGSIKDVSNLAAVLSNLEFEVEIYSDLTLDALKSVLLKAAGEDHSDADCICIVVMTHGHEHGRLTASDQGFEVSDIWSPFTADKCKTLAGKPKLIFLQACRGSKQDAGSIVDRSVEKLEEFNHSTVPNKRPAKPFCVPPRSYKIPTCSDILLAFSSARGFASVRDLEKGSWFVQSLCEELRENGRNHHLLTILTFVCQKVAIDYQTMCGEKQMPTVVSMLTRLLYFRCKPARKHKLDKKYLDSHPYQRLQPSKKRR